MSEGLSKDNEMIDVEKLDLTAFGVKPAMAEEAKKRLLSYVGEISKETAEKVSPPGTFNIPPLLEKRRLEWQIPDGIIRGAPGAVFDRILLWQIPVLAKNANDTATFGGGLIAKSDQSKEREQREAPRAVLVGAGLKALDTLRSNGIDIGHIVNFSKNTTYAIPMDYIAGKWQRVSLARDGDIILSEDLAEQILKGEVSIARMENEYGEGDEKDVQVEHYYQDKLGRNWLPMLPGAEDDL